MGIRDNRTMTGWLSLSLLLTASAAYAVGGLFMKRSAGLTQMPPTLVFLALFVAGALVQARAMKDGELGPAFIFVLGAEAVLTVIISAMILGESYSVSRLLAITLVVVGVGWLRTT
jgi:multidrug transporter EmrE-like cation transporter